jgi:hypothetical protein
MQQVKSCPATPQNRHYVARACVRGPIESPARLRVDGFLLYERSHVYHLDRGYERIERKLGGVGADIERITLEGMP